CIFRRQCGTVTRTVEQRQCRNFIQQRDAPGQLAVVSDEMLHTGALTTPLYKDCTGIVVYCVSVPLLKRTQETAGDLAVSPGAGNTAEISNGRFSDSPQCAGARARRYFSGCRCTVAASSALVTGSSN